MATVDTVGKKYYEPLRRLESCAGALFWIISILSIAALVVNKNAVPHLFDLMQIFLIVAVLLFFIQGQVQRIYLMPRAEDARRQELLSNSFNVPLTHETTVDYYNNEQTNPLKRLTASVMESAFFTQEIVRKMLVGQRIKTGGYLVLYVAVLANRSSNLEILVVAAQAVFSEEIIARWLRMEWLRARSEKVFDNLNRLFTGKQGFSRPSVQSQAIEFVSSYETAKATAGILLSSKQFEKHNERLTSEWGQIRGKLGL